MLTSARLMMLLLAGAVLAACGENQAPEGAADGPAPVASRTFHMRARGMVKKLGIT